MIARAEFKRLRTGLRGVATQLAAVWDPLRRALNSRDTAGNDPFVDVLQLPKRSAPPVVLLWLPYERNDAEILDDLHAAYSSAIGPVETLAESLDELLDDLGVDRMVEEPEGGKGCLGWALIARASSGVIVKICSSRSSDRESVPFSGPPHARSTS